MIESNYRRKKGGALPTNNISRQRTLGVEEGGDAYGQEEEVRLYYCRTGGGQEEKVRLYYCRTKVGGTCLLLLLNGVRKRPSSKIR